MIPDLNCMMKVMHGHSKNACKALFLSLFKNNNHFIVKDMDKQKIYTHDNTAEIDSGYTICRMEDLRDQECYGLWEFERWNEDAYSYNKTRVVNLCIIQIFKQSTQTA